MQAILNWLSGKKTYFIGFAAIIYGGGVAMGLWPHNAALDLILGGTATVTMRASIAKSSAATQDALDEALTPPPTGVASIKMGAILFLAAIPALLLFTPACNMTLAPGGAYSTVDTNSGQALGPFIFGVDKTLVDSKDVLVTFLSWEEQNRASLTGKLHSVTVAADAVRLDAPLWFTNAWNLRSNYLWIRKNAPSLAPGASNNLQSAVTQLSSQAATATALKNSH